MEESLHEPLQWYHLQTVIPILLATYNNNTHAHFIICMEVIIK